MSFGKLNFEEKIKVGRDGEELCVLPLLLMIAMMDEEAKGEKNKQE